MNLSPTSKIQSMDEWSGWPEAWEGLCWAASWMAQGGSGWMGEEGGGFSHLPGILWIDQHLGGRVLGGWGEGEEKWENGERQSSELEDEDEDEDGASGKGCCGCAVEPRRGEWGVRCEDSSFPGWVWVKNGEEDGLGAQLWQKSRNISCKWNIWGDSNGTLGLRAKLRCRTPTLQSSSV